MGIGEGSGRWGRDNQTDPIDHGSSGHSLRSEQDKGYGLEMC